MGKRKSSPRLATTSYDLDVVSSYYDQKSYSYSKEIISELGLFHTFSYISLLVEFFEYGRIIG